MNKVIDDLQIYVSYHLESQLIDYNIKETKYVKLINLLDYNKLGDLINFNKYFNEFESMLYIYYNQIYSKYIGFCHYRRMFETIDLNLLRNNKIFIYKYCETQNVVNSLDTEGFLYDKKLYFDFYKFMIDYSNVNISINKLYNILYGDGVIKLPLYETYICGWEQFNNIMFYIDKFLTYYFGNKLQYINIYANTIIFNNHKEYNNDTFRSIGFFIERLIGIMQLLLYENDLIYYDLDTIDDASKYNKIINNE